jgi:rRNA maturation endonuclease Nob1
VYYCNNCETEIDDEDIGYLSGLDKNFCKDCGSNDVDYFNTDEDNEAKNQEG